MARSTDFDFPSNNNLTTQDVATTIPWLQWFQRIHSIVAVRKKWQDMSASRALGITYTNGTGREITVSVQASSTAIASVQFTLSDGTIIRGAAQGTIGQSAAAVFQIPNGETYRVTVSAGTGTLAGWMEYR